MWITYLFLFFCPQGYSIIVLLGFLAFLCFIYISTGTITIATQTFLFINIE